jgi:transketolase
MTATAANRTAEPAPGRPTLVLANTVKGRGLPYVEGKVVSHFAKLGPRERRRALAAVRATGDQA